ncbi:MAG: hypothetical protein M1840_002160 [Geoglossum simile]|nr:MAG: hypothetical protein M1840_002160 [Geoglossum simile]
MICWFAFWGISPRLFKDPITTSNIYNFHRPNMPDLPSLSIRPPNLYSPPAFARTSISNNPSHIIRFRHPAYPSERDGNLLFILQAYDHPNGGLHHETARVACGIVTGNVWDGYFSLTPGGPPIDIGRDELLLVGTDYFFHVPYTGSNNTLVQGEPFLYPVCPVFQHWEFPHHNLPPSWVDLLPGPSRPPAGPTTLPVPMAPSALTSAVISRDGSCRISGCRDGVECAHLCPRTEDEWFTSNGMAQYNLNHFLSLDYIMDDQYNAIALRSDLHGALDRRSFTFVPKATPVEPSPIQFVTHMLQQTSEIGPLYHNTSILPSPGVKPEFLLTRFAWAIFPLLTTFLASGSGRNLILVVENKRVEKMVSATECSRFCGYSRSSQSRSISPRKRKTTNSVDDGYENTDPDSDEGSSVRTPPTVKRQRRTLSGSWARKTNSTPLCGGYSFLGGDDLQNLTTVECDRGRTGFQRRS